MRVFPLHKSAVVASILASMQVACTSGGGSEGGASPTPSVGSPYAGREVKDTGCDQGAFDVAGPKAVNLDGLSGTLSLRRSGKCDRIYWARFEPKPGNTAAFTVVVELGDQRYEQKSEPKRPDIAAWTVGAFGTIDQKVKAYVINRETGATDSIDTQVV